MFSKPAPKKKPSPPKRRAFRMLASASTSVKIFEGIVRQVGTAIIGGNFTGGPRGKQALDIQVQRGNATKVASGLYAIAFGRSCRASGDSSVALGDTCSATGGAGVAIGSSCSAAGDGAVALGFEAEGRHLYCTAVGQSSIADALGASVFGLYARAGVDYTTNICGPLIAQKGGNFGDTDWFIRLSTAEIALFTNPLDLKAVADYTLTLPDGCRFFVSEIGLIATTVTSITQPPFVRAGHLGSLAAQLAPSPAELAMAGAGYREVWSALAPNLGEPTLTCGVTVAATGTAMSGRFYWKGLLVENE